MDSIFEQFGTLLTQNVWISIAIALIAGVISSFTPCSLSSIPLIIGYIENYSRNDRKKAVIYSIIFSLGLALTLTTLGIFSAILGNIFFNIGKIWYLILGIITLAVGFKMLGIINSKSNVCNIPKKGKGILGAFLLGILGGIFSSPCSTPVLIAILTFVAEKRDILLGGVLLLIYSIGQSLIVILAGTSVGIFQSFLNSNSTNTVANIMKYIFSIIILLFGLYMIYLGV